MEKAKGKRLKKYSRGEAENLPPRRITPRSIEIIDIIYRYRIIPTSLIVRLVSGDIRTTERHLQNLYHQGLVNRWAFPSTFYPTEFNYYLDDKRALTLLVNERRYASEELDYKTIKKHRDAKYFEVTMSREMVKKQGRLMHLHHELMISRFHYMLERACQKSGDKVWLLGFYQGTDLWNQIETPGVSFDREGNMRELEETKRLPHRPDAFFGLHFADRQGEDREQYFFYEADRQTSSKTPKKFNEKLRAHFHYIVKQKLHTQHYGVNRIRAVLIESTEAEGTERLRLRARHPFVSGAKPSLLFWFTPSDISFERPIKTKVKGAEKDIPLFLDKPEIVFERIWATPLDDSENPNFQSLIE